MPGIAVCQGPSGSTNNLGFVRTLRVPAMFLWLHAEETEEYKVLFIVAPLSGPSSKIQD